MRALSAVILFCLLASTAGSASSDLWKPFADESVVEIVTSDPDGAERETKIWIVVLDGRGYVRTNDSRWLANIRRGSAVALRVDEWESAVAAEESSDPVVYDRVEQAFKDKYGLMQRIMSWFRLSDPTVLRLTLLEQQRAAAPRSS